MKTDLYGLPVSAAQDATLQAINDFIHGFIAYENKSVNILPAADADPDCCLANSYAGMLWMFLEADDAASKAAPYIARAEALASNATLREQQVTKIVAHWAQGDIPALLALCDTVLETHPRDMVVLKLAQYHHFNHGDALSMLRVALGALPQAGDIAHVHGMVAFGYEQCHLLDQAETAARRALELVPTEPWAHHAIAHVMLTQGRIDEGIAFLEGVAGSWANLNSFMHTHNWWHLALFYLSRGRSRDVLDVYDTHVWGIAKEYSQDQVGAISLLARVELAGIDVGDRWRDVADHVEARGPDTVNPFLSLQYLYALARVGRAGANALMQAIEAAAADDARHDREIWAEVALPAAEGLVAHAAGDFATCIARLGQALPRMAEAGGSHAQRDLFEQIHLDALIRGGRDSAAQQVLEMRRGFDPDGVADNLKLAAIYDAAGLGALADAARKRAETTRAAYQV